MLAQPSLDRAVDDLEEARSTASKELVSLKNTDLFIASAGHNNTTLVLNITVQNSGSTVVRMEHIDLLLNGTLMDTSDHDGEFLYPGCSRVVSFGNMTDPRSVRMVGPWGITDSTTSIHAG
ncbi:MAG: hypothetical protein R6V01_00955 [Thermoplasmatota archaeon]